jgi:hypothetical protein
MFSVSMTGLPPSGHNTHFIMKHTLKILALLLLALFSLPASADPASRIREDFLDWKLGMSIHYSVATHHDRQWATGTEDSAAFKPDKRDCNQWLHAAAAAAMKYAVLTV